MAASKATKPLIKREIMRSLSRRYLVIGASAIGLHQLAGQSAVTTVKARKLQQPIVLGDSKGHTKGPYTAFMAPYNKGSLLEGADYQESFRVNPETFPEGSMISWNWPTSNANAPVRAFLAIDFGNYYNTMPESPIRSSKVQEIGNLICNHKLSISGTGSGFNVIINFFLTASRDPNSIMFEIEVFLHTSESAGFYLKDCSALGTFDSAQGFTWTVVKDPGAVHGPDLLFRLADESDLLTGSVDLREMLLWLKSHGVITGDEYFNGLAIGVEPQQRNGTLIVNALSIDYVSSQASRR